MNNESWTQPSIVLNAIMASLTLVGIFIAVMAFRASRDAVNVMREQIKASTRPYVVVDLDERGGQIFLTVENAGISGAHNVKLIFPKNMNQGVFQYRRKNESGPAELTRRPIAFLAPRKKLEELIYEPSGHGDGYDLNTTVEVNYKDSSGVEYQESITLAHDGPLGLRDR